MSLTRLDLTQIADLPTSPVAVVFNPRRLGEWPNIPNIECSSLCPDALGLPPRWNWAEREVFVRLLAADASDGPRLEQICDFLDMLSRYGAKVVVSSRPAPASSSTPWRLLRARWRLNSRYAYVQATASIFDRRSHALWAPKTFVQAVASTYFETVEYKTPGGKERVKHSSAAALWLQWEHRFEVRRIVYEPGKPATTASDEANLWREWGTVSSTGSIEPWTTLLDYMFQGDVASRRWFEQWCAYPIQHPGAKLYSAVLLWGHAQGTGKGLIAASLSAVYGRNAASLTPDMLSRNFNAWAAERQFVFVDEIFAGSNPSAEYERWKNLITKDRVWIDKKYEPQYELECCTNFLLSSNNDNALALHKKDRRLFVWETPQTPLEPSWYANVYDPWLRGTGPAHLMDYLLKLDLTGFVSMGQPPLTAAKAQMIAAARSELGLWVDLLKEAPGAALAGLGDACAQQAELLPLKLLLRAYDPHSATTRSTGQLLARELVSSGFPRANQGAKVRFPDPHGPLTLYVVRNPERWLGASTDQLREHVGQWLGLP